MTSETLVLDAQRGDAQALANLLADARPVAQRMARRHVAAADADDVVQNALLIVLTRLDTLAQANRFEAWLGRIVLNEVRRAHRDQSRQRSAQLKLFAEPRIERGLQPMLPFRAAIDRLPENQQRVLMRRYVDGDSYVEAGTRLGIPVPLVRSRLQRARVQLRKELTMANATDPISLAPEDLNALVRASRFCTADKSLAHFGILLAKTGHAVATDGHRLLIQNLPALQALPEDLLVEPNGLDAPGFGTEPASLTVKLDEVEIETSADHWAWGLRRDVFPDYRKVLPEHPRLVVEIDPERLNRAFADVEPFLASRHPPLEGFVYTPAVEIEITAQCFALTTTDVMGYHACNGVESRPAPPDDRWRHEASFHIDSVTGHSDVFRFGVNAHYLADSLNAVTEGDVCTLALFAPHRSVVFANGDGTRTSVTMPMG